MNKGQLRYEQFCAWSGVVCVLLFFGGFVCADFIPPIPPSWTASQVAAHYQQHTTGIRIGMILILISSLFYGLLTATTAGQMRRIPGLSFTVLYTQLVSGAVACLTFLLPAVFFVAAAFRPERSPELTQTFNDLAWIMVVIPWMPFMPQNFSFAFAILSDKRAQPLFPRWLGYFNIWATISFTPAVFLPFFKSGPFAWDGLWVFWVPATIFTAWFGIVAWALLRAMSRE